MPTLFRRYRPHFDIWPAFKLGNHEMFSCDEGDGEPGSDPVNVHDIVHGDQGVSYLMVCPQQEGEGGGEVTSECLRR